MPAWLRRGRIFHECALKNRGVRAGHRVRERLVTFPDDRHELACETIAESLQLFGKLAVAGCGWSPTPASPEYWDFHLRQEHRRVHQTARHPHPRQLQLAA